MSPPEGSTVHSSVLEPPLSIPTLSRSNAASLPPILPQHLGTSQPPYLNIYATLLQYTTTYIELVVTYMYSVTGALLTVWAAAGILVSLP